MKSNGSSSVQSRLIHSHASASASTLFNTMDVAAQYYDCCVENALLGLGMFPTGAHPFHPRIPPAPATPKGPLEDANRDGSGLDDYRSYKPSVLEKGYLQGVRAAAEGGAGNAAAGMPIAAGMLKHFLDNSGERYRFDVNGMLRDVSPQAQPQPLQPRAN
ncbi:hypothetical protein [Gordonia sputi]|uniref:hypothetical protein n=1 Tax=Gordonia sputi TaxID=36823 RepID=UPI002044B965|nr:hypothetical protein [Gordonia sputi]MCM3894358.1 hypothetical protein [Gordonia sputi]